MASEKKPSIYSERSSIGSADELDEYGVWVKSEPQVLSAGSSDQGSDNLSQDFEELDFPSSELPGSVSENNFETGFEDFAITENSSDSDIYGKDDFAIPTVKSIENNINSIQEDFETSVRNKEGGDLSTQLLMKIANELSSIRGELHALKKEFSVVRASPSAEKDEQGEEAEHERSGFFSEEEDETIALTGDELDNILNTADFTEEAGADETPEADFPAGDESEELSGEQLGETFEGDSSAIDDSLADLEFDEKTEETASGGEAIDEDFIDIDADALGIDLKPENILDETSVEETDIMVDGITEDDIAIDDLSSDDFASGDTASDELSMDDITADGVTEDDIAIGDTASDDLSADDLSADDLSLDDAVSDDLSADDLSLDDAVSDDLSADDLSADDLSLDDAVSDELSADDLSADDLSLDDAMSDELSADDLSFDEIASDDLSADDLSLDAISSDDLSSDDLTEDDIITSDTAADDIEASGLDSPDTLSDEAETEVEASAETETETGLDDFDAEISQIDDISDDFNIDLDTDDLSESDIVDIDEEKDSEELEKLREEGATPVTFPPEDTSYLEEDEDIGDVNIGIDDSDSLDLSDAVIDEPELSADSIVDGPATEPDIDIASLDDFDTVETDEQELEIPQDLDIDIDIPSEETDVSELAKDDFNISSGDDFAVEESSLSDDSLDIDTSTDIDDSIDQVIPEGFEAELEETPVPFDDDLEGHIAAEEIEEELELPEEEIEEIAPPPEPAKPGKAAPAAGTTIIQTGGKDDFQLTSKLKSELKNILSYMDQLLESLPEEKIEEFARSEYFDSYKKLFKELGLV